MTNYAVVEVDTGLIVNRIVIDDPAGFEPDAGFVLAKEDAPMEIGGRYAHGIYMPPPPPPAPPPTADDVTRERDRRTANNFVFGGVSYQLDDDSQRYITAKGAQAKFAIAAGAQPGDLRWAAADKDFGWIATDNSITSMDAQTMSSFAEAADEWVTAHIMACHAIKATNPIPSDFAADHYWP